MSKAISNLQFEYMNTSERRVLDLAAAGLAEIPMLGYCNYRNPRPDVPEHWHPGCVELHYCVRNALGFGFNGRSYRMGPGEMMLNLPGEWHTVGTHPKGLIMYWMIVRVDGEGAFLGLPGTEGEALRKALLRVPHRHFRGTAAVKRLFQSLHMLADEAPGPLRALRLRLAAAGLLLEVLAAARGHRVPAGESRIEQILAVMEAAPERAYTVEGLAREAGMAPNHFITRFRERAGLPPRQYLLACRVAEARRLLRESGLTVTEIAMRLGFCSSQHFATLFKRHTGITPLACRAGEEGVRRTNNKEDGQSLPPP